MFDNNNKTGMICGPLDNSALGNRSQTFATGTWLPVH